jgi:hypothetical protein
MWDLIAQHELYSLLKATLKRRIDGINMNAVGHKQLFGRTADLPEEVEKDLGNMC